jgi:hypothetical protein
MSDPIDRETTPPTATKALEMATLLVRQWPHDPSHVSATCLETLSGALQQYPLSIGEECCDPRVGLARGGRSNKGRDGIAMARPEGTGGEDDRKTPAPGKHSELIAFADRAHAGCPPRPSGFQIDGTTLPGLAKGRCPPADRGGVGSQRNHGLHQTTASSRAQNSKIIAFCARFFAPVRRTKFAVVQPNSSRTAHENAPYQLPFKIRAARRGGAAGRAGPLDDLQRARIGRPQEHQDRQASPDHHGGLVTIGWWASPTARPGTQLVAILEKYVLISVTHSHQTFNEPAAGISFDDIKILQARDESGRALAPVPRDELPISPSGFLSKRHYAIDVR